MFSIHVAVGHYLFILFGLGTAQFQIIHGQFTIKIKTQYVTKQMKSNLPITNIKDSIPSHPRPERTTRSSELCRIQSGWEPHGPEGGISFQR